MNEWEGGRTQSAEQIKHAAHEILTGFQAGKEAHAHEEQYIYVLYYSK